MYLLGTSIMKTVEPISVVIIGMNLASFMTNDD